MLAAALRQGVTAWMGANLGLVFFFFVLGVFAVLAFAQRRGIARNRRLESRSPGSRAFLLDRGWTIIREGAITWTRPLAVQPLAGFRNVVVADFAWGASDGIVCAAFVAQLPGMVRIAIEMADLPRPLPPLVLCPAVLDHTFTQLPSAHAFVSESADFNAAWVVRARDARYASAVLTPRFMERLLMDDASDMWLIIDGGALITITPSTAVPNDRIAAHLAVLRDLMSLITPAVYTDFGTGSPGNSWRWAARMPGYSWLIDHSPEASPSDPVSTDDTIPRSTDTVGTFFPQDFDPDNDPPPRA